MLDRGWRLSYPGTAYDFGGDDPLDRFKRGLGRVTVTGYERTETNLATEDTPLPRTDGLRMGQDYRQGLTHTFTLLARGRTRQEAESLIAAAEAAWRGDGVRFDAGALAELTFQHPGGDRRTMLGRPRRFQPNYDRLSACQATATATFETASDVQWGPEQTVRIDLRAVNLDGFVFPIVFPLVMSPPTTRTGVITPGGTMPTPVVVEFHGPITNPSVQLVKGWKVQLLSSIPASTTVTLDSRPWVRSITDRAGASYAGALARPGRLADMLLQPGQQQLILTGQDPTRSAFMVVRWRPAFVGRR